MTAPRQACDQRSLSPPGSERAVPQGAALERDVAERARRGNVRLIGPNSVGIINTGIGLNATFAAVQPRRFPVSLISQSGAVATAILDWARTTGVGFSKFISLGNTVDIDEVEVLQYLCGDAETNTVVLYLESLSHGRAFLDAARSVTRIKPIIAMKVGRSAAGARAAASHTGALASVDAVVDAAFGGSAWSARTASGRTLRSHTRVLVRIASIGPAYCRSHECRGTGRYGGGRDRARRTVASLRTAFRTTRTVLSEALPAAASVTNPVDVLGDARSTRYARALELCAATTASMRRSSCSLPRQ